MITAEAAERDYESDESDDDCIVVTGASAIQMLRERGVKGLAKTAE